MKSRRFMAGLPGAIFLYRLAQRRLMERWLFGVQRGRLMRRNGKPEHERSFYGSGGDRKSTIELPPPDQRDLTSGRCCHRRSSSSGSNGCAQRGAKLSVMLDVPLATHGFTAGFGAFGIKQYPFPPSSSTWRRHLHCVVGGVFRGRSSSQHMYGDHFCVGFPAHKRKRASRALEVV